MAGQIQIQNPKVNPGAFSKVVGLDTDGRMGVIGSNPDDKAFGFLAGKDLVFKQNVGVYGESDQQGVMGLSEKGTGVYGGNTGKDGTKGIGVRGETFDGVGVQGRSFGAGQAALFIGRVEIDGILDSKGDFHCTGNATIEGIVNHNGDFNCRGNIKTSKNISAFDVVLSGADCAEDFDIAGLEGVDPGTVMVVDTEGELRPCHNAYDKKVTGVISGGGDYKPGIVLDKRESISNRLPLALVGKVYCKVDATYGPVEVGDLLTTSPTLGHGMKAIDPFKAFGSVIGKALRPLAAGQGLIPILVALQ